MSRQGRLSSGYSEQLAHLYAQHIPDMPDSLSVGDFTLEGSPGLALAIAEGFARLQGMPGYVDFLAMHEGEPKKPHKPSQDEIEQRFYKNPPPIRGKNELRFFQRAFEFDCKSEYISNIDEYEKELNIWSDFKRRFPPSPQGYLLFVSETDKEVSSFFFDKYKTLPISEEARRRHTYIVGGSGSGKSELIKSIFYHYLTRNKNTAVVLIEPHGKLSREVARWPELQSDRLVYIRPGAEGDKTPVFNPFDISDDDRKNPRVISVLVDDTIDIIAELLERDFTFNMDTLLRACLYILYNRKGSSFLDVLRFVDLENNKALIEVGRSIFPEGSPLRSFILYDLPSQALGPTRQAIKMRFTSLLSRHFISSFLIGKSSFDLDAALMDRKFIVFNLSSSDIGATEARIFGKLILAHLKAFGFRQGREEYPQSAFVPVHVFVDECQEFITPALAVIIEQLRKFGIHLTLAQQSIGQGMNHELESAVLANTAVKITGRNSEANIRRFCAETGADPESLGRLSQGKGWFCIHSAGMPPVVVKTPAHRLDGNGGVSDAVWHTTLSAQMAHYYAKRGDRRPLAHDCDTPTADGQKCTFDVARDDKPLKIDY